MLLVKRKHKQPACEVITSPTGFQEAVKRQVDDMVELLGPDWDWFGVGRDDGAEGGEYSPIFFRR